MRHGPFDWWTYGAGVTTGLFIGYAVAQFVRAFRSLFDRGRRR